MTRTIVMSAPYEVQLARPVPRGDTAATFTQVLTLPPYMTGAAGLALLVPREPERFIVMWDLNQTILVNFPFLEEHPAGEAWLFPAQEVEVKYPAEYRRTNPRVGFLSMVQYDMRGAPEENVVWMDGLEEYLPFYVQRNPTTSTTAFGTPEGGRAEMVDRDFLLMNRVRSNMLPCSLREDLVRSEQGMRPLTERERWRIDTRYAGIGWRH